MKKRIYISVPITGQDENKQRARVTAWENILIQKGWDVENPFTIGDDLIKFHSENGLPSPTWDEFMEVDLPIVERCHAILMLDGWEYSRCCRAERSHAYNNGLGIHNEGTFLV